MLRVRHQRLHYSLALLLAASCTPPPPKSVANSDDLYRSIKQQITSYQYKAASEAARQAWLSIPDSESGWRFKLQYAQTLLLLADKDQARKILHSPPPATHKSLLPQYHYLTANIALSDGVTAAPEMMRSAIAEAHAAAMPEVEAEALLRLWVAERTDQSDQRQLLEQALDVARQNHLDFQEARALNNLGFLALSKNRYAEAIPLFQQAASHAQRVKALYIQAAASQNLGECFFQLGDFGRALAPLFTAERLLPPDDHSPVAIRIKNEIGTYYALRKQDPEALRYYRQAFAFAQLSHSTASDTYVLSSLNLATALIQAHAIDEAEKYNQLAHHASSRAPADISKEWRAAIEVNRADIAAARDNLPAAVASYRNALDIVQHEPPGFTQVLAYAGLAETQERLRNTAEARHNFERALASIETNRGRQVSAQSQITFLSALIRFYQQYLDFLIRQNLPWAALAVADSSRGSVLGRSLTSSRHESNFKTRLHRLAHQSNTAILFYAVAPQSSYVWALTPTGDEFKQLSRSETELELDVATYSALIQNRRDTLAESNPVGQRLYQTLIAPIASHIKPGMRVIIVPDGPLHGLNYETLLVGRVNADKPHYLLEDVNLTVAPSLRLLLAQSARSSPAPRALIIGDPVYTGSAYPDLPESKREVAQVCARFPNASKLLTQQQAIPDSFSAAHPEQFSLIHISAHVEADPQSPLDSAIILSPDEEGARHLYARDFMRSHLHADLVTVSGCSSVGKKVLSGEGMVGFAWAAFDAGARNAITSLWEVDDRSTTELMDHFYAGVTGGQTYSASLRNAKLQMLRSNFKKPFYWAPFQLYTRSADAPDHTALH